MLLSGRGREHPSSDVSSVSYHSSIADLVCLNVNTAEIVKTANLSGRSYSVSGPLAIRIIISVVQISVYNWNDWETPKQSVVENRRKTQYTE